MSNVPKCNAKINGRNVYSSGLLEVGYGIMGFLGTLIYGSLFLFFLFVFYFSKSVTVLMLCILFLILAIRDWYLMWRGGCAAPERPCINNAGLKLV